MLKISNILRNEFNSSSAAVRTGLVWLDNTSTSLHVRFESSSIHHQLQYALYCTHWKGAQWSPVRTAADDELN